MKDIDKVPRVPIKLVPAPVERVWGGRAVERAFGWTPPDGKTIGEWWNLSFRRDHPSHVAEGMFTGIPLPQLVEAHPELIGENQTPDLLIKILDSADRLSVQVHPDDGLAKRMGLDSGKTECWYYLESEPDAVIYCGLAEGLSPDSFFEKVAKNPPPEEMEKLMTIVPVREGDLSFICAGTIHAIGKGVLLMEVQQNSDTTFRIYDWGRPREVHIDESREAVVSSRPEPARVSDGKSDGTLVHSDKFAMTRYRFDNKGSLPPTGKTYASITCLEGEGTLTCKDYSSAFQKGETYFLPAGCPGLNQESAGKTLWILSQQYPETA
jgi:mannose-6-phosphate isomerase